MTSRVIEYKKELAEFYDKSYRNHSVLSDYSRNRYRVAIKAMKSMMNKKLKQIWILFGILLGWYRECRVFSYATDLGFITWSQ
jgi:hypothetical protein